MWDFEKCWIRSDTIAYSIKKMKETKLREKLLLDTLTSLEESIVSDTEKLEDYLSVSKNGKIFRI